MVVTLQLPLYQTFINAGFPSPAENEIEAALDLNALLIKKPAATFFLKVAGFSMVKAGIHHGDILIVDRSLEPRHGKIVIAAVNGELTVKRLHKTKKRIALLSENENYPPLEVTHAMDLHIWGVVTYVIHQV